MNKEEIIKARNAMIEYAKYVEKDKEVCFVANEGDPFYNINKRLAENYTDEEKEYCIKSNDIKAINKAFHGTKSSKKVYVCLGAYYLGMGPDRIKSNQIFKKTKKGTLADIKYYIDIEDTKNRISVPITMTELFEHEHKIIHLTRSEEVENNFEIQEQCIIR